MSQSSVDQHGVVQKFWEALESRGQHGVHCRDMYCESVNPNFIYEYAISFIIGYESASPHPSKVYLTEDKMYYACLKEMIRLYKTYLTVLHMFSLLILQINGRTLAFWRIFAVGIDQRFGYYSPENYSAEILPKMNYYIGNQFYIRIPKPTHLSTAFPMVSTDVTELPEPVVPSQISPELPSVCQEGMCHNGGTCHPLSLPTGATSFQCDCPLHFTGRFCEKASEKNFGEQFLHLYLVEGRPTVRFSCGNSQNILTVSVNESISKGILIPITISYMLPVGSPEGYCMIRMAVDGNPPVQHRLSLSYRASQIAFGSIFLGNVPVYEEVNRCAGQIVGYKGCIRDFQVNNKELFIIDEALGGRNIENCNVPICDYHPCRNGGTCTRRIDKPEVDIFSIVYGEKFPGFNPGVQVVHVDYTTVLSSDNEFIFMRPQPMRAISNL
ncbi:hypothetical protein Q9966_001649 [Columba livia]|nr:hypothetical protein Q9966_001649 [Columba livia]